MFASVQRLIGGLLAVFQGRGGSTPEERRRLIRVKCEYPVSCIVGNRQFSAKVLDMGLNGMRLEVPEKLRPNTTVYVHHPKPSNRFDNEHVICQVRWCRKRRNSDDIEVGVKYADSAGNMRRSWVKFLLKELGFDERAIYTRRKAVRAPGRLPSEMMSEDGQSLAGQAINLGVGGALFESPEALSPGSQVRMRIGPYRRYKPLLVSGTVISAKRQSDSGLYHTSVRFADPTSQQVRLLGDYVISLLKDATS